MPAAQPQGNWSAEYDKESQTMTVVFPNGRSYQYDGMPPDIYEGFMKADSKGSYFNTYIRGSY